jgi:hypothetical protein
MNHEQLIASYPDEPRKHAANSGWNAANTAMFNAILDQAAKASEAGNFTKASALLSLTGDLQDALALKRV